jgi:hypothetical protein
MHGILGISPSKGLTHCKAQGHQYHKAKHK